MKQSSSFDSQKQVVTIESIVPLDADQLDLISSKLDLQSNEYIIKNRHNPSLIAGIRIIIAGKIIDLSFQHQLNQLTQD